MSKSIYQEDLLVVRDSICKFRQGVISISDYQRALYDAECRIVSIEETRLRELLMNHENEIEEIRFTIPEKDQSEVIGRAVDRFEDRLKIWIL